MNNFRSAIDEAAQCGSFIQLHAVFHAAPQARLNPSLKGGLEMINQARDVKGFVPYQDVPDPALTQLAMMRALLPDHVGMLLTTVPPGSGLLSMADGSYYVFCTESKYVIVEAGKTCRSGLMTLPAGVHRMLIAAFGWWDRETEPAPPFLTEDPVLYTVCDINVQPGVITEVVPTRVSNFSKFTFNTVYH